MSDEQPLERFVVTRQIDIRGSGNNFRDNTTFTKGEVPGVVLDQIKGELLLHLPGLENHPLLDRVVESIPRRLARSEEFDHDARMEADERWKRGMFKEKKQS